MSHRIGYRKLAGGSIVTDSEASSSYDDSARHVRGRVRFLEELAARDGQTWGSLAKKYGSTEELPPWKVNLDGLCDALDDAACTNPDSGVSTFIERRDEEDMLVRERYDDLPFPENQLVALAHSLVVRGIIDENALEVRVREVKERLSR